MFHLTAHSTKLTKDQGKCFSFLQQGLTLISTTGNLIILEFFWLRITQKQRQLKQQATKYSLHFNLLHHVSESHWAEFILFYLKMNTFLYLVKFYLS